MALASGNTGREELAAILGIAVRSDGPVRLYQPRGDTNAVGIFPSSKGRYGDWQRELLGTLLEEVATHPRMVKLTALGIERLLQNTHQGERAELVLGASPLYRDALLSTWKRIATKGEQKVLTQCAENVYSDWLGKSAKNAAGSLDEFRELFAQEVANSWNDSKSAEAKRRLAHLLKLLGAQPLGKEDETVDFTGLQHIPLEPLFKGDPAKVVTPGWTFPRTPTPLLLVKAAVRPAVAAAS